MQRAFGAVLSLFCTIFAAGAEATTYLYEGKPFTQLSDGCSQAGSCGSLSGFVAFNFDTSHFSGTRSLSSGDTAVLEVPAQSFLFPFSGTLTYPYEIPPPDIYAFVTYLAGNFTFDDGNIVAWTFGGGTRQQNCGGGPGCASGTINLSSTSTSDYLEYFDYFHLGFDSSSNDGGGVWTEIAEVVPEPSTWVMLLIGFAGLAFAGYRRSVHVDPKRGHVAIDPV
jgi:hypothetical protein